MALLGNYDVAWSCLKLSVTVWGWLENLIPHRDHVNHWTVRQPGIHSATEPGSKKLWVKKSSLPRPLFSAFIEISLPHHTHKQLLLVFSEIAFAFAFALAQFQFQFSTFISYWNENNTTIQNYVYYVQSILYNITYSSAWWYGSFKYQIISTLCNWRLWSMPSSHSRGDAQIRVFPIFSVHCFIVLQITLHFSKFLNFLIFKLVHSI